MFFEFFASLHLCIAKIHFYFSVTLNFVELYSPHACPTGTDHIEVIVDTIIVRSL